MKVEHGIRREYLLERSLVERVQAAAAVASVTEADVVRAILEDGIDAYEQAIRSNRRQQLEARIAELTQDEQVARLFELNRERSDWRLPAGFSFDEAGIEVARKAQQAVDAFRELRSLPGRKDDGAMTVPDALALYDRLVKAWSPALRRHVNEVRLAIEGGSIAFRLTGSARILELGPGCDLSDDGSPGTATPLAQAIRELVTAKRLAPEGSTVEGRTSFRLLPIAGRPNKTGRRKEEEDPYAWIRQRISSKDGADAVIQLIEEHAIEVLHNGYLRFSEELLAKVLHYLDEESEGHPSPPVSEPVAELASLVSSRRLVRTSDLRRDYKLSGGTRQTRQTQPG
jgi:hypothetical protein